MHCGSWTIVSSREEEGDEGELESAFALHYPLCPSVSPWLVVPLSSDFTRGAIPILCAICFSASSTNFVCVCVVCACTCWCMDVEVELERVAVGGARERGLEAIHLSVTALQWSFTRVLCVESCAFVLTHGFSSTSCVVVLTSSWTVFIWTVITHLSSEEEVFYTIYIWIWVGLVYRAGGHGLWL